MCHTILIVLVSSSSLLFSGCRDRQPERAGQDESFSVRFPYAESGRNQGGAWEKEIEVLTERVTRDPKAALELTALAGLYVEKARRTGEHKWLDDAEKTARRSLEVLPTFNDDAKLVLAKTAQARHDFARSIEIADEILRIDPSSVDALSIRATSNLARGKLVDAERDADVIAIMRPSSAAYSLRGSILEAQGRDEEAMFDFRAAIQVESVGESSASAWSRSLIGRQHLRLGRLALARTALEEALRASENYPMAVGLLAELDVREGKLDVAMERYESSLMRAREPMFLVKQGEILLARGSKDEALAKWKEAEAILREELTVQRAGHRGELAYLLLLRAHAEGTADGKAEAVTLMQEEAKDRQDWETLAMLAHALEASGRLPEARQAARAALSTGIRDPELYRRAGAIERASGRGARGDFYDRLAAELTGN